MLMRFRKGKEQHEHALGKLCAHTAEIGNIELHLFDNINFATILAPGSRTVVLHWHGSALLGLFCFPCGIFGCRQAFHPAGIGGLNGRGRAAPDSL